MAAKEMCTVENLVVIAPPRRNRGKNNSKEIQTIIVNEVGKNLSTATNSYSERVLKDELKPPTTTSPKLLRKTSSRKSTPTGTAGRHNSSKKVSFSRKPSESIRQKVHQFEKNIPGFNSFKDINSIQMSLDWISFQIRNGTPNSESTDNTEDILFTARQTHHCSLSVTGKNEIILRQLDRSNVLRVNSHIIEDVRHFNYYLSTEKYIGSVSCDSRQNFRVPGKIENAISGQSYSVQVDREGDFKCWSILQSRNKLRVATVQVLVGHRWKSMYTLTFEENVNISSKILCLGFLLALASARLESEIVPFLLATSAFVLTFLIFFIIQFT